MDSMNFAAYAHRFPAITDKNCKSIVTHKSVMKLIKGVDCAVHLNEPFNGSSRRYTWTGRPVPPSARGNKNALIAKCQSSRA